MHHIVNSEKKQNSKRPLKRSKTGFEIELHLIDNKGNISYEGEELLSSISNHFSDVTIEKECGKNMIELGCYPDINTYNPGLEILRSMEKVIFEARKKGLRIYPFSTYPGKIEAKFTINDNGKYDIQEKIFGKEKFSLATKAVGFHHHYTLPKGVFDPEKKELRLLIDSKLKRSLINSYNFEIAIDPILTLLTQSSPFFEGKNLAKNSRMLIYRGGKKLGYPGLYSNLQQLGGLPPYKQTQVDLLNSIKNRRSRWRKLVRKADSSANFRKIYPYKLDISWHPVKINKHGTLEQRGMDMNYMSIIMGITAILKFCLRKIQREFIEVIPADIGMTESFSVKKGIMYIPPHTYVRNVLQKASAYEGFENEELYEYTRRFFRFAKKVTPEFYHPLYDRIKEMIDNRRSVSDEIIMYAKSMRMITKKGTISDRNARKIVLRFSKLFFRDLKQTKKVLRKIMTYHKEHQL